MNFLQKIYFSDKTLILTTDKAAAINDNPGYKDFSFFKGATLQHFTDAVKQLGKNSVSGAVIEDASGDAMMKQLLAIYHIIDAAGGVAYNEQGALLLIYRRGKWDLPKGKLDKGETIEACALREVSEETGLKRLTLAGKICDTYHIYTLNNEQVLKRTAWYKMMGTVADKLKPQKEENIIEARWVSDVALAPLAAKSYEAVREVLRLAGASNS